MRFFVSALIYYNFLERRLVDNGKRESKSIAWTHHERWDGNGYPRQLKGEAIPVEGRIAAIADAFDALTTQRVYKPAFSLDHAVDLMAKHRGEHFDPELLDIFFTSLSDIKLIHDQYADQPPRSMIRES